MDWKNIALSGLGYLTAAAICGLLTRFVHWESVVICLILYSIVRGYGGFRAPWENK